MDITINIEDYITEDRIKEIAEEELRYMFRKNLSNWTDLKELITTLSYSYVFDMVAESFKDAGYDNLKEALTQEIIRLLTDGSTISYEMFLQKSPWQSADGPALTILREECEDLRPLIHSMAKKHIMEYPFDELDRNEISFTIGEAITQALVDAMEDKNDRHE